ncbi:MAG: hypothetical protein ABMB14_14740 [Myxococcota bacterium]
MVELHLVGMRAADESFAVEVVRRTLGALGLAPSGPGVALELEVRNRGTHGLWLTGESIALEPLPGALARAADLPVRQYRIRVSTDDGRARIEIDGWTWWPDQRRVPIPGVKDADWLDGDDLVSGASALARSVLEVTVEQHEAWHHDDAAVFRWHVALQ